MASTTLDTQRSQATAEAAVTRPAYGLAAIAFAIVLTGYVLSLAPTVTFWDAGEFIATAHILGIPHPPGTPLFVILGHTWDLLIPFLPTAYKMNLMSATCSAGASYFFFLFMHESLRAGTSDMPESEARIFRIGGAFAATLCAAFAFTVWQVSTDSGKVYSVAMFLIALSVWLTWLWRRERGGPGGAHLLLLIIYILGLALANHLIGLLGGPALFAFMWRDLTSRPARIDAERQVQWAQFFVAVALWISLVGLSMGSSGYFILYTGLFLYLCAAVWAWRVGTGLFGIVALIVAAAGLSTYAFLYLRAGQHPFISEADGSTWRNLWAIIGREQYPPRSPTDNPIFPHGPDNPGRTVQLLGLQLLNWIQYFDWQWAGSLMRRITLLAPARMPFTILFILLGWLGAREHKKLDNSSFALVGTLFLTTGLALVIYLNFKPGFSIAVDPHGAFPSRDDHEVRERDYFFTISFLMWGLWAGLGIAALYRRLRERLSDSPAAVATPVFALALLPAMLNFSAANRRFGPAAWLAHDFAYDMLIGVAPYGLLITNGDNDTFPLWYLQEVEGVRQDVMVVNLSLINTDWYIRQLRDNPTRPYRPDANALKLFGPATNEPMPGCTNQQLDSLNAWADRAHRNRPDLSRGRPMCLHMLNDDQIAALEPQLLGGSLHFAAGHIAHDYPAGTPFYVKDVMVLKLIIDQLAKRPIYFSLTAGIGNRMGLDRYVVEEGFNFRLFPDSVLADSNHVPSQWGQAMVDVQRTHELAFNVFKYAGLFSVDSLDLEPTDDNIASNLSIPFMVLGDVYRQTGRMPAMLASYRKAVHLSPIPELKAYLRSMDNAVVQTPAPADTAKRRPAQRRR